MQNKPSKYLRTNCGKCSTPYHDVLQNFLAKIVSPNDLYKAEFLNGLSEAQDEVANKELAGITDFASYIR